MEEFIVVEDASADALEAADAAILDAMAEASINPVAVLDDVDDEVDPLVVEDGIGAPTI